MGIPQDLRAVNNESAYLSLCSKSVPQISYNGLFSYTEDAIFQFHGIESKHRAFLIQGQFIPIHCEDRPAGLLQDDPRSVVIPWRGSHGYKQICPACGHFTHSKATEPRQRTPRTFRESRIIRSWYG